MNKIKNWVLIIVLVIVGLNVADYKRPDLRLNETALGAVIRGGDSSRAAKVDNEGKLEVTAVVETDLEHASESGLAFTWVSEFQASGADEVMSIQNTDADKNLLLEMIELGAATTTEWNIFEVTSGTPGGTTITAQNYNLVSGVVADETSFGNAAVTGTLTGNTLLRIRTNANDTFSLSTKGLILGKNSIVAITATFLGLGISTTTVTVTGHFETE